MERILQAIKELKDRMNAVELKLSQYIDGVHKESTESISETESTIVDLEIQNADFENSMSEAESTIVDIEIEVAELKNIINKE